MKYKGELQKLIDEYPQFSGGRKIDWDHIIAPNSTCNCGGHFDKWGCVWSNVCAGMEAIVTGHLEDRGGCIPPADPRRPQRARLATRVHVPAATRPVWVRVRHDDVRREVWEIIPDLVECGVDMVNPQYCANCFDNLVRCMMCFPENNLTIMGKKIPSHYTVIINKYIGKDDINETATFLGTLSDPGHGYTASSLYESYGQ